MDTNGTANISSFPETGFVRLNQILTVFPGGKSSWWQGVKDGRYPQPRKIGPNITVWIAEELREIFGDAIEYKSFPETGFVRLAQVLEVIPVSKSTWHLGVKNGVFPNARFIGPNTAVYAAKAIRTLIAEISAIQQFSLVGEGEKSPFGFAIDRGGG